VRQLYLRRFRRICPVIGTLRRVKWPGGRDRRWNISIMTNLAITTHKSHMSRDRPRAAASAPTAGRSARCRAAGAAGVGSRSIPGLVFAPVRPGIVAACMVEPPDSGRVPGLDRPRWTGQSETDKRNIVLTTGKSSDGCPTLRNFRSTGADGAQDLPLATLRSNSCVQSNIFKFVMT
jgi:hypothetical protein